MVYAGGNAPVFLQVDHLCLRKAQRDPVPIFLPVSLRLFKAVFEHPQRYRLIFFQLEFYMVFVPAYRKQEIRKQPAHPRPDVFCR